MHISEFHNNDYSFMEVLGGLCKENINHENDILFTDIVKYWNKNNKFLNPLVLLKHYIHFDLFGTKKLMHRKS